MRNSNEIQLDAVLSQIDAADETDIDTILQKLIRRYHSIHPETELLVVTIPRNDPRERRNMWKWFLDYLDKYE